ncbi:malto-oligosyltrehalose synthase [soil metagenome]
MSYEEEAIAPTAEWIFNPEDIQFEQPRIPNSTYRLQFRPEFGFDDAAAVIPYLAELGIDTVYASPHFAATPGSTHGYDVVDPNRLNEELGGEPAYERLHRALKEHGLGLVVDIVPNHMGIGKGKNTYWQDVLENGRTSPYAEYFDIDWEVSKPEQQGKVLLPILGEFYGVVLENGEFQLSFDEGRFTVHYYETPLPIAPPSYGIVLRIALGELENFGAVPELAVQELTSLISAFDRLPVNSTTDPDLVEERRREQTISIRRLAALTVDEPAVREAIEIALTSINGEVGDATTFDAFDQLFNAQSYRLAYWRVAAEEINYRRFFAINELAAVRQEVPAVFESTHGLVSQLISRGMIDGLRIDHIDGLWNPEGYLSDLQRLAFLAKVKPQFPDDAEWTEKQPVIQAWWNERWSDNTARAVISPLFVVVEKILEHGELMPASWPIAGSTGYEFARAVTELLVDSSSERAFTRWYQTFTSRNTPFAQLVVTCKRLILQESLSSELNVLAAALDRLSERRRRTRDFTLNNLRFALQEVIASFPIYRTYVTGSEPLTPGDRKAVDTAIATAIKRNPASDRNVFAFVRQMLVEADDQIAPEDELERLRFVMRFQHLTGPVMAKGLEDTAFYRNYRLTALNEVGGEPNTFGITVDAFHKQISQLSQSFPHSLLASSTHDTKRSEDARARLVTLSEFPRDWQAAVNRWSRFNRKHRTRANGTMAPTKQDEALFYQSLVAIWPPESEFPGDDLADRISAYLQKAAREAQEETSWTNPDGEYETALDTFVRRALDRSTALPFLTDFSAFVGEIERAGAITGLAMQALKLTSPGVPDLYQGTEIIDLSLVDPDNRRLVDFAKLSERLRDLKQTNSGELAANPENGQAKLFATTALLHARNEYPELFRDGAYRPLTVSGELERHVIAFERRLGDERLIVVALRFVRQLQRKFGDDWLSEDTWKATRIQLAAFEGAAPVRNLFTGDEIDLSEGDTVSPGELFDRFPVVCLMQSARERLTR